MHSLYWRIFLAFWVALALILVGTVTVAVNATAHRTDRPWVQRGQLYAQAARAFESGGPEALRSWLQSLPAEPFGRTFVVEPGGRELLGRLLPPPLSGSRDAAAASGGAIAPIGGALVLVAAGGSTYHVVIGPVRGSPRLFGELELPGVPLTVLAIALGVSAAVCFFLARYLASPVERLRLATRQLASGDLNVRVLPALKGRQDDLGLRAADLDAMAERLRLLLEAKQQLLRDVSHELRSPLARLQLALSLARREDGAVERHLARIECEAQRLEALIARTLKLVSLERPVHALEQASVDVAELLRTILADVASPADATVGITAHRLAGEEHPGGLVEVVIRDQGPGVPEKELGLIFEPFYRVDAARGHGSAGEGLGLAIAARAVALHGGQIAARNGKGGGLSVTITLPAMDRARSAGLTAAATA